jgi:aminopeptidase
METTEDSRIKKFAEILVERGADVQKGDNVYLMALSIESLPLFKEVRRQVIQKGGRPYEHFLFDTMNGVGGSDADWFTHSEDDQLQELPEPKLEEMKRMDAYIRIGGSDNSQDLSGVKPERISKWKSATREILNERLSTKWVATRFPTNSMAQKASMSTSDFEEMVFSAVNPDYDRLEEKNRKVKEKFDGAEEVRIESKETDITLSLKDREGVSAHGKRNIPDGEVFYAPVKESIEGHIKFTYPGVDSGSEVHGIKLWFENGKIVDFEAEENEEYLEKMLNTDEGSRYIGELGIGTNREITDFTKDTLFDEKMGGTIHMAIGRAYEECAPEEVRNDSAIHWDIVNDLRPKAGGGKIVVDGEIVQRDGEWQFEV